MIDIALLSKAEFEALFQRVTTLEQEIQMANASLQALEQQVAQTNGVVASAVTLIQGIAAQLQTVRTELAAQQVQNDTLDSLAQSLDASEQALAAAVAANSGAPAAS